MSAMNCFQTAECGSPGCGARTGGRAYAPTRMDAAPPPPSKYPPGSLRELLAVAVPLAVSTGSLSVASVVDRTFWRGGIPTRWPP